MKPKGGVEVYLYSFLNLGARGCERLTARPGRFTPRERDPVPNVYKLLKLR